MAKYFFIKEGAGKEFVSTLFNGSSTVTTFCQVLNSTHNLLIVSFRISSDHAFIDFNRGSNKVAINPIFSE